MSAPTNDSPDELKDLIRTYLRRTAFSLGALIILVALTVVLYREQLDAITAWVLDTIGLPGIVALIYITDSVVSPFPPDTVLLLLSRSTLHSSWYWVIPFIGAVSTLAGLTAYAGGYYLADGMWGRTLFGKFRETRGELIKNYGFLAVALGALTPLPFSITCWSAGLLKADLKKVWPATLLRIPRYVVYYWVIALSPSLMGIFQ